MTFSELCEAVDDTYKRKLTVSGERYRYFTDMSNGTAIGDNSINDANIRDGDEFYVDSEGVLHNHSGPATVIKNYPSIGYITHEYYIHGKKHRLDGPAEYYYPIIGYGNNTINKQFYINGKKYSEEEYNSVIKNIDKENMGDMLDISDVF